MNRYRSLCLSILAGIPGVTAVAQPGDSCPFEAERTATVDAARASMLEIVARAGGLVVAGREGLSEVRVHGLACASTEALLDGIELSAERRGRTIRVEALMPDGAEASGERAYLNLVLEVPAGIETEIEDSSGSIELSDLGALTLRDRSGAISARDITGSIELRDASGAILVERVEGDVDIVDESGEINLRNVTGSVAVTDGSGAINVTDTTGDVTIRRDGSGGIRVANVGGDFTVERDGTGGVRYNNVAGAVRTNQR